jgi:hypothetical protein
LPDDTEHIDLIAEHLEGVTAGQIKQLLNQRAAKSTCISIMWPTRVCVREPFRASRTTRHLRDRHEMGVRLDAKSATTPVTRPHGHFLRGRCRHPSRRAVYRHFRATVRRLRVFPILSRVFWCCCVHAITAPSTTCRVVEAEGANEWRVRVRVLIAAPNDIVTGIALGVEAAILGD